MMLIKLIVVLKFPFQSFTKLLVRYWWYYYICESLTLNIRVTAPDGDITVGPQSSLHRSDDDIWITLIIHTGASLSHLYLASILKLEISNFNCDLFSSSGDYFLLEVFVSLSLFYQPRLDWRFCCFCLLCKVIMTIRLRLDIDKVG